MKTCCEVNSSRNGFITKLVAKQKIKPNVMEIGNAGKAFRQTANNNNVKHKPINIATKQAIVVVQSPYDDAFPTNTE